MLTRRGFLTTTAAALTVAACGGCDSDDSAGGAMPDDAVLVPRFPNNVLVPGAVRLPMSLASLAGDMVVGGPDELRGKVVDAAGTVVASGLTATRRTVAPDLPSYWPFSVELDQPGIYALQVDQVAAEGGNFQLLAPADVTVPLIGDLLPAFDTPTLTDPRGVVPICTRLEGVCPLHERTLTDALATGRPVLYVVGTPGHCATQVCGPGLEYVLAANQRLGDAVAMVHADIYTDETLTTVAPAVRAYGLTYEPVVFLAGADDRIVGRLDAIWDQTELDQALTALV